MKLVRHMEEKTKNIILTVVFSTHKIIFILIYNVFNLLYIQKGFVGYF